MKFFEPAASPDTPPNQLSSATTPNARDRTDNTLAESGPLAVRHVARPRSYSSTVSTPLKRKFTPIAQPPCSALRLQQQRPHQQQHQIQLSSPLRRRLFGTTAGTRGKDDYMQIPSEPERGERLADRIARAMGSVLPQSTREQYFAYKKAEDLWIECRVQGEYTPGEEIPTKSKFWYEECDMVPCLRNWCAISGLHVWLIMVRLRHIKERERAKLWQQFLINHFFYDIEDILVKRHKVDARTKRQKVLKETYEQFRYAILSYDEAFIRGDAAMAAALWTTLFMMREDMDFHKLAVIVSYMRRILSGLEKLDEQTILDAQVYFGNPINELEVVEKLSVKPGGSGSGSSRK
ncbi:hypothetical protein DRE_03798 [Drechslerella stenobrocha 248]|uniref:Ubiquinol-cytochrome c chaperone domain-containing protein n=1 Tax=Drechslerella stenobrocha 248 TaxID=1043628 RepID=W7HSN0_9PEZI|nr:hypothetical protein DRE_03798 [Drechslerella stenobrocha 248]